MQKGSETGISIHDRLKDCFNSIGIKKVSIKTFVSLYRLGKKKAPHVTCRAFFVYFCSSFFMASMIYLFGFSLALAKPAILDNATCQSCFLANAPRVSLLADSSRDENPHVIDRYCVMINGAKADKLPWPNIRLSFSCPLLTGMIISFSTFPRCPLIGS